MKLAAKLSLTVVVFSAVLSILLGLISISIFSRHIYALNKDLFFLDELDEAIATAYEQDELFFEGVYTDIAVGQRRILSKLNVQYRNAKESPTFLFIVDAEGRTIAHPAESRWSAQFPARKEKGEILLDERATRLLTASNQGEFTAMGLDGRRRIYVYKKYEPWGWVFCMTTPTELLNAPVYASLQASLVASLLALFMGTLVAIAISRRFVRPIYAVVERMEGIARGKGNAGQTMPVDPHADDEVRKLILSFNQMIEKLQAVSVSRDYMNSILNASPLGVFLTAAAGDCLYTNFVYQTITGLRMEQSLGKRWTDGVYPEDRERVLREWAVSAKQGQRYESHHRYQRPDGTILWARVIAAAVVEEGRVTGYIGTVEDITEQKTIESAMRQSEKMVAIGQLAGGIAHDLNNGLSPVMGYLDMLLLEAGPNTEMAGMLTEAKQSAQRCVDVVQKLLNFSRPASLQKAPFTIQRLLVEFQKLAKTLLPATVTVRTDCPDDVSAVLGNESEVMTVLVNMAVNARDAMGAQGTLTLEGRNVFIGRGQGSSEPRERAYVMISVTDTGKGISPHVVPRIFEPFFTTKQKSKGTGLGLSMAYNIVKDHEGWIEVSSVEGKGTSFHIYFPAAAPAEGAGGAGPKQEEAGVPVRGTGTVLFVDDEEALRNMGRHFLQKLGYTVQLAGDGEEAVQIFGEDPGRFAAVVLDMTMPKLSGMETLQRLLKIDPHAKIILASGYTAEATTQELLRAGAVAFISKPYAIGPLAQTLHKALR